MARLADDLLALCPVSRLASIASALHLLAAGCASAVDDAERAPEDADQSDGHPGDKARLEIPPCEELNALWVFRYHEALHVGWPLEPIDCTAPDAPSFERAFAEAAYVLEHTRFDVGDLPDGYEVPPRDMLSFVSAKYVGLHIDKATGFPYTDVENKLLYFYADVAKETGFSVVGNLIHEARHADDLQYLHKPCTAGPNAGREMCDEGLSDSFTVGGPHPVTLLYFAWAASPRSSWPVDKQAGIRDLCVYLTDERINATDEGRVSWKLKYLTDF